MHEISRQLIRSGRAELAGCWTTARLIRGDAPTTVNLHDVMFGAPGDRAAEIWPVFPREPQHGGLLGESDDR